jgi:hypothetical protein
MILLLGGILSALLVPLLLFLILKERTRVTTKLFASLLLTLSLYIFFI